MTENHTGRDRGARLCMLAVDLFWIAVLIVLTENTPLIIDDLAFRSSQRTGERLTTFAQLIDSVAWHYMHWGGRPLSIFLTQGLLMLPKHVFNVLDALVFATLAHVILGWCHAGLEGSVQRMATLPEAAQETLITPHTARVFSSAGLSSDRRNDFLLLNGIYLMFWFFTASFFQVTTWVNGSVIYMWMNLIVLSFGLLYFRHFLEISGTAQSGAGVGCAVNTSRNTESGSSAGSASDRSISQQKNGLPILRMAGLFLYGLCAGASIENALCVLAVGLILYFFWSVKNRKRIGADYWAGMIGAAIGGLIMLLAPGSQERAAVVKAASETGNFLIDYSHRIGRETYYGMRYLLVPLAIALFLYLAAGGRKNRADQERGHVRFFFLSAFIGLYVMTFSCAWATRVLQFPLAVLIIAAGRSLVLLRAQLSTERRRGLQKAAAIAGAVLLLYVLIECVTGLIASRASGVPFDRVMMYTFQGEPNLMPGNGAE